MIPIQIIQLIRCAQGEVIVQNVLTFRCDYRRISHKSQRQCMNQEEEEVEV